MTSTCLVSGHSGPRTLAAAARLLLLLLMLSASISPAGPLLAQPTEDPPETSDAEGTQEIRVSSKVAGKGEYRLTGSAQVPLEPREALAILTAFDQHCAEGCRWPISSIDHMEILERDETEIVTWTRIDDVMDASYFQRARYRLDGETIELVIEVPEPSVLRRLESEARPHAPFFHSQRVTWRLSQAAPGSTRAEVEMEMSSDRFLINLMPNRVLEGAEANLHELFAHLAAAQSSD